MLTPPPLAGSMRFALYAGLNDVEASIRRTLLGPLWSTVGLATAIASLGLFFGTILRQIMPALDAYYAHLATGLVVWTFLASCVHQSSSLVWSFLNTLRHNRMSLLAPVLRVIIRNLVGLGLNLLFVLLAARLYYGTLDLALGPFLCGLALLIVNVTSLSYLAALACARFRDLPQLIAWGIHLAFFLTPILWFEHFLTRFQYLLHFNPLASLVAVVRQPVLGEPASVENWLTAGIMSAIALSLCWLFSHRTADRLPYWL